MQKVAQFKIKGMQRDLSVSAFNPEYAYENMNIRIMPTDDSTLLSVINEKGNKALYINGIGETIVGIPIGQAVVEDELILFTCDNSEDKQDKIYKFWFQEDEFYGKELFSGNLKFNTEYPIETLAVCENKDIKKVYWTDNLNQPRVINVVASQKTIDKWNENSFDFIQTLSLKESINIVKNTQSSGTFSPGVIQYAFTYYTSYGQESNIFYTSPLYYISYEDRGASPEDKVNNSFDITIDNIDKQFDYIRVYSIQRTSINGTPSIKRVVDLSIPTGETLYQLTQWKKYSPIEDVSVFDKQSEEYASITSIDPVSVSSIETIWELSSTNYGELKFIDKDYLYIRDNNTGEQPQERILQVILNNNSITIKYSDNSEFTIHSYTRSKVSYTDTGTSGDQADPTELLYVGGEEILAGTITQKDNTLFLGNITIQRKLIDKEIIDFFKNGNVYFKNLKTEPYIKSIKQPDKKGYYPYKNQLTQNSNEIKTFKYLEYYRFGVQFQHNTGKWSEPIWINDIKNNTHIESNFFKNTNSVLPVAEYVLNNQEIIDLLYSHGYTRVRPVVVYPTLSDREVICQGVLCPTVFNVEDRYTNSPFAQSSWFFRPNLPFDLYRTKYWKNTASGWYRDWRPLVYPGYPSMISSLSRAGLLYNGSVTVQPYLSVEDLPQDIDLVNRGSWAEFRHHHPIPSNIERNAEIQCIYLPPRRPYVTRPFGTTIDKQIQEMKECYYVDQSIVTLHSPDIEFDDDVKNLDKSNLQLRIVGVVPLTSFASDIDIQTSTTVNNFWDSTPKEEKKTPELPMGFYKENISRENDSSDIVEDHIMQDGQETYIDLNVKNSCFGNRLLMSGGFWFDEITGYKDDGLDSENPDQLTTGFVVYPWHRNGSLNNTKFAKDGYRSAMLDKKKLSNLRYSYNTQYLDIQNIWDSYIENDPYKTGISGVAIFDSNEVSVQKVPAPLHSNLNDIIYYGNIDKLLVAARPAKIVRIDGKYEDNPDIPAFRFAKKNGYPIIMSGRASVAQAHDIFKGDYTSLIPTSSTKTVQGTDPVRIKYKSTPHAVLALNYTLNGNQRILPTITDRDSTQGESNWSVNYVGGKISAPFLELQTGNLVYDYSNSFMFWDKDQNVEASVVQDIITDLGFRDQLTSEQHGVMQHGWLWLGELYNPNVKNRFGGQTEEAFENNQWLPCGEPVSLINEDNTIKESVTIQWTEGDTYYQRYDNIKTYPFTLEDQNSVTEILSFMCETRINLDGRYDRNRGNISNLATTPQNFNKINNVYSQENNYFNYRAFNHNRLNINKFNNIVTWTKTKTSGELIDAWTNITLASTLEFDGDKGSIQALKRYNNNLIAFQDKGISQILYNENMQIASTEGVPIEIANSGKVMGKRYFTNSIGCNNKWSICETPQGLYFIDTITKGIYLFNGSLTNLSDNLGFHSWINKESKNTNLWNPVQFDNFVTYYDKVNSDVFFINKDWCLGYSEPIGQFTSFYSYENTPYFANIGDVGISFNTEYNGTLYKPWLHNGGDYNMFFNKYRSFYTTLIANNNSTDKIFNNIEFRSDTWDKNGILLDTTFDTLNTWNEYQEGAIKLNNIKDMPSPLKKKFRVWRANIPRDMSNNRDRMRNPWLYIKLSMQDENINRTVLHDVIVRYFE